MEQFNGNNFKDVIAKLEGSGLLTYIGEDDDNLVFRDNVNYKLVYLLKEDVECLNIEGLINEYKSRNNYEKAVNQLVMDAFYRQVGC